MFFQIYSNMDVACIWLSWKGGIYYQDLSMNDGKPISTGVDEGFVAMFNSTQRKNERRVTL